MAARFPGARQAGGVLAGWIGLGRFWAGVLLIVAAGAAVLAALGPPPGAALSAARPVVRADPAVRVDGTAGPRPQPAPRAELRAGRPGRDVPGPVAAPDPSLLEPYGDDPSKALPRIADDGRAPMAVYAAGFDPTSLRPRVGMLVAGLGLNEADSLSAIKDLPGGVTLAFSPYAGDIRNLLDVARMTEHEYLLAIPMEPQGYPVNDPDDRHALMTSLPPEQNLIRLRWVLSRLSGYAGVTNAFGPMRGERLAGAAEQFGPVLEEAGHRGLLFIDARTQQSVPQQAWNRSVDVAIDDDPVSAAVLDERLGQLTRTALDKGSALGIVWLPRPVTLERVAAWASTLPAKGLALAPVSALVLPPAKQEAAK